MLLLVSVMLLLWKLKCSEGIEVRMSIPRWDQPPSMAPSHPEARAGTWEEWTLIPSLPPSRAQTETTTSHEKKHVFWETINIVVGREAIST